MVESNVFLFLNSFIVLGSLGTFRSQLISKIFIH